MLGTCQIVVHMASPQCDKHKRAAVASRAQPFGCQKSGFHMCLRLLIQHLDQNLKALQKGSIFVTSEPLLIKYASTPSLIKLEAETVVQEQGSDVLHISDLWPNQRQSFKGNVNGPSLVASIGQKMLYGSSVLPRPYLAIHNANKLAEMVFHQNQSSGTVPKGQQFHTFLRPHHTVSFSSLISSSPNPTHTVWTCDVQRSNVRWKWWGRREASLADTIIYSIFYFMF